MLNRVVNMAFGAVLGKFVHDQMRKGSIKAVKQYIEIIRVSRMAAMALVGVAAVAAVLVAGIVLMIVGIIGLLPIEPNAVAWSVLGFGVLLTVIAGVGVGLAFSEKRWLEASKAYEMMDLALSPWEGLVPPNPTSVFRAQAKPVTKVRVNVPVPHVPKPKRDEELIVDREVRPEYKTDFSAAYAPGI